MEMNYDLSNEWLRCCIAGSSAMHILAMLHVLDGEWKEKDNMRGPIGWDYYSSIVNATAYAGQLEPWRIAE